MRLLMTINNWNYDEAFGDTKILSDLMHESTKKEGRQLLAMKDRVLKLFPNYEAMMAESGYKPATFSVLREGFYTLKADSDSEESPKESHILESNFCSLISEIAKGKLLPMQERIDFFSTADWNEIWSFGGPELMKTMILNNFDMDRRDKVGRTALGSAVIQDNIDVVKDLLSHGVDPNNLISLSSGKSAYSVAKDSQLKEMQELLVSFGARGEDGNTLLFEAVKANNIETVKKLLEKPAFLRALQLADDTGDTPLAHAVLNEKTEIVKILLIAGANPNWQSEIHKPLHKPLLERFVNSETKNAEIFKFLIDAGASLDCCWENSILFEKLDYLKLMIEKEESLKEEFLKEKLSLHTVDYKVFRLYYYAFFGKEIKVLKLFNELGISVNTITKNDGISLLAVLSENLSKNIFQLSPDISEISKIISDIDYVLSQGADPFISKNTVDAMLQYAVWKGDISFATKLLAKGANVIFNIGYSNHNDENSALVLAIQSGNREMSKLLINGLRREQEAIEKESGEKNPLLIKQTVTKAMLLAVKNKDAELVKLLLDARVNPDCKNKSMSPLILAATENNLEIVQLLVKYGADLNIAIKDKTPLSSIQRGGKNSLEIADFLLSSGANPHFSVGMLGTTNVMHIVSKIPELIPLLIKHKINLDIKDKNGRTALMYLCAEPGDHFLVLRELLKGKPKLDVQDNLEQTAIMIASQLGNLNIVNELLHAGARDEFGRTQLALAITQSASLKTLEGLIKSPTDLYETDYFGNGIAHFAVRSGRLDVLEMLNKRGYDFTLPNHANRTPLHDAFRDNSSWKNQAVIDFFIGGSFCELFNSFTPDFVYSHFCLKVSSTSFFRLISTKKKSIKTILRFSFFLQNRELAHLAIEKSKKEEVQSLLEELEKEFPGSSRNWLREAALSIKPEHFISKIEEMVPLTSKPVELTQLLFMFNQINFYDKNKKGYRDPALLKDDGSTISVDELRKNLNMLITRVKSKEAFFGTPPSPTIDDPDSDIKLKAITSYFNNLDYLLKNIILKLEDPAIDFDQKASVLIDLAIAGNHCGARYMSESRAWFENLFKRKESLTLRDNIEQTLINYRLGVLEKISLHHVIPEGTHVPIGNRAHTYNQYLYFIGKSRGIPGFESAHEDHAFWYSNITPDKFSTHGTASQNFDLYYNPTSIIDRVMSLDHEPFLMWYKDNLIDPKWDPEGIYKENERKINHEILQEQIKWKELPEKEIDKAIDFEINRILKTYGILGLEKAQNPEEIEKLIQERVKGSFDATTKASQIRSAVMPLAISKDKRKSLVEHMVKRVLIRNGISANIKDLQNMKEIGEAVHDFVELSRREEYLVHEIDGKKGNTIIDPATGKMNRDFVIQMLKYMDFFL